MKTSGTLRVLIVAEDTLTRMALAAHVDTLKGHRICGTAEGAKAAQQLREKEHPDLVVIALPMPGGDGLGLVRDFARREPKVRTVVIGNGDHAENIQRVFQAGARAFVDRHDAPAALEEALAMAMAGRPCASPRANEVLLEDCARRWGGVSLAGVARVGSIDGLTGREQSVFEMTGRQHGSTAISRVLSISVKTVETHKQRIKEKLGIADADALRERAMRWVAEQDGKPALRRGKKR